MAGLKSLWNNHKTPATDTMINSQHYPKSVPLSELGKSIIGVFQCNQNVIDSDSHELKSVDLLLTLADGLRSIGFVLDGRKAGNDKMSIPMRFSVNGRGDNAFRADGYHQKQKYMIEVEAGRAVTNYEFLKELFKACTCDNVDAIAIAVRNIYRGSDDFSKVCAFMDTAFSSQRLSLPLKEVLIIGY